jgi:NSS family neurotransmitter:Na+ symporter
MLEGKTIFDLLDFFTANILLPLGGLLVALMAGWVMSKPAMEKELALSPGTFNLWFVTVRFITPIAVGVVFIYNLM